MPRRCHGRLQPSPWCSVWRATVQAEITTTTSFLPTTLEAMHVAGQMADQNARENVLNDYTLRKAASTVEAQFYDLQIFSQYLNEVGIPDAPSATNLQETPSAWDG